MMLLLLLLLRGVAGGGGSRAGGARRAALELLEAGCAVGAPAALVDAQALAAGPGVGGREAVARRLPVVRPLRVELLGRRARQELLEAHGAERSHQARLRGGCRRSQGPERELVLMGAPAAAPAGPRAGQRGPGPGSERPPPTRGTLQRVGDHCRLLLDHGVAGREVLLGRHALELPPGGGGLELEPLPSLPRGSRRHLGHLCRPLGLELSDLRRRAAGQTRRVRHCFCFGPLFRVFGLGFP